MCKNGNVQLLCRCIVLTYIQILGTRASTRETQSTIIPVLGLLMHFSSSVRTQKVTRKQQQKELEKSTPN